MNEWNNEIPPQYKLQVREIPLFHGDQWEATVPSLLGLAPEDQMPGALQGVDKDGNLLRSKKPPMFLPFPCLDVLDVFRLIVHQLLSCWDLRVL